MRAMIELQKGQFAGVDVYRNGNVVTVVGAHTVQTPHGPIQTMVQTQMSVQAFEYAKARAKEKFGMAYSRMLGRLQIDDDIRNAPPLPNYNRMLGR